MRCCIAARPHSRFWLRCRPFVVLRALRSWTAYRQHHYRFWGQPPSDGAASIQWHSPSADEKAWARRLVQRTASARARALCCAASRLTIRLQKHSRRLSEARRAVFVERELATLQHVVSADAAGAAATGRHDKQTQQELGRQIVVLHYGLRGMATLVGPDTTAEPNAESSSATSMAVDGGDDDDDGGDDDDDDADGHGDTEP